MITCPWCGTNYTTFQSNCQNCGGPLPAPGQENAGDLEASLAVDHLQMPPPAPRPISNRYAWRLLMTEGWGVAALVFIILGIVFLFIGVPMTLLIITAFVGIPFALLGLVFMIAGAGVGIWRYQEAQKVVQVLQIGEVAEGQITQVNENYNVRVNGRNPWAIHYQFNINGQAYDGEVNTLNTPGPALQPGRRACILYLPEMPNRNSIYPHP